MKPGRRALRVDAQFVGILWCTQALKCTTYQTNVLKINRWDPAGSLRQCHAPPHYEASWTNGLLISCRSIFFSRRPAPHDIDDRCVYRKVSMSIHIRSNRMRVRQQHVHQLITLTIEAALEMAVQCSRQSDAQSDDEQPFEPADLHLLHLLFPLLHSTLRALRSNPAILERPAP